MEPSTDLSKVVRTLLVYVSLVLVPATLGVVLAFLSADSVSPNESAPEIVPSGEIPGASRLLFAIAFVSLATTAGGWAAKWLRQPQVVGQMTIGLAIGPSLLGRLAPGVESWLFPAGTVQILVLFGGIGAILFIFLVGLDFSVTELRRSSMSMVVLGQGTMAIRS